MGWFGWRAAEHAAAEPLRRLRGGRRGGRAGTPPDRGDAAADRLCRGGVELGKRVAHDPGSVAVPGRGRPIGLLAAEGRDRGRVDPDEAAKRPGQCLLNVRLGIPDELPDEIEAVPGDDRLAAGAAVDERDRGHGATDEPAFPAGRGIDELLEFGPAIRLVEDAQAGDPGQRVDRDPVAGLAGRPTDQLPCSLGLVADRSLEQSEGEPAELHLGHPEEPVGDEEPCARALPTRGLPEATLDGPEERSADAQDRPDPRRDPPLAVGVVRIGQLDEGCPERGGERRGVVEMLGKVLPEGLGPVAARRHEGDRPFGRGAARRDRGHRATGSRTGRPDPSAERASDRATRR